MKPQKEILHLPLSEAEIINIIKNVKERISISKLDNIRPRHPNIQFDCLLRGYVGEYAIAKWLAENDIVIDRRNVVPEEDSVDIDFLYKGKIIELKTSLIPDTDKTLENAVQKRDIKLIKREEKIEDLRGDVHVQIVYRQKRNAKDTWLAAQPIDLESTDICYLYDALLARAYRQSTYLVGWMEKPMLVEKINKLPASRRTWTFSATHRSFWSCPIRESRAPWELIPYLTSL